MLDTDALLAAYLDGYGGYGSLDAPWWFVGMEEGGQPVWHDFVAFLHDWHRLGQPARRSLRPPPDQRAGHRWFGERPQIQPYWAKLIRIRLAADGRPFDTEAVRGYQAADLAAAHSDTCLLELLPLPASSTIAWPYSQHSNLDVVADRDTYHTRMAPRRAQRLRDMMSAHLPRYVVFLGSTYRQHWEQVADRRLPTHPQLPVVDEAGTRMIVSRHPTARGSTNREFEHLGRALAAA